MIPGDIEVVAFDLDNTLYDESQYFEGAFAVLAPKLAALARVSADEVTRRLRGVLRSRGRHYNRLFNDVLEGLELDVPSHLPGLLDGFRHVRPSLTLFPGVAGLLDALGRRYRLGLITSGIAAVQENKIALLGIRERFEQVVLSSTLPENKPGCMPFVRLLEAMRVPARRAIYVGDNPFADFRGANEIGMCTVQVRNPEFAEAWVPPGSRARAQIAKVTDLPNLLSDP